MTKLTFVQSRANRDFAVPNKYQKAPVGHTFGSWEVIGYSHYLKEHYWFVECSCGFVASRRAGQLVHRRSSSCRTCSAKEREANRSPYWKGLENISCQYLTRLKYRNKLVQISMQDLVEQWKKQEGRCIYTNMPLSLVYKDTCWNKSTASIDRIDSTKGYMKDNIQWVHKRINTMKSDMTESEFLNFCALTTTNVKVEHAEHNN